MFNCYVLSPVELDFVQSVTSWGSTLSAFNGNVNCTGFKKRKPSGSHLTMGVIRRWLLSRGGEFLSSGSDNLMSMIFSDGIAPSGMKRCIPVPGIQSSPPLDVTPSVLVGSLWLCMFSVPNWSDNPAQKYDEIIQFIFFTIIDLKHSQNVLEHSLLNCTNFMKM